MPSFAKLYIENILWMTLYLNVILRLRKGYIEKIEFQ